MRLRACEHPVSFMWRTNSSPINGPRCWNCVPSAHGARLWVALCVPSVLGVSLPRHWPHCSPPCCSFRLPVTCYIIWCVQAPTYSLGDVRLGLLQLLVQNHFVHDCLYLSSYLVRFIPYACLDDVCRFSPWLLLLPQSSAVRSLIACSREMDLLRGLPDTPLSSSSDENEEPDESFFLQQHRQGCQAGTTQELRNFSAECVGHDMTWKGSLLTRVVALQTGGTGRNRHQWGMWWGHRLLELKADIGILSETRIVGPDQQAAALQGLNSAGYIALSHSAPSAMRECSLPTQQAAGVVIATHRSVASNWLDISRDERGSGHQRLLAVSQWWEAAGGRTLWSHWWESPELCALT